MDELKITSKFMRAVLSKLIKVAIYKKFGYKIDIQINEINVTSNDGNTHVHLNVDGDIDSDTFKKFTKIIESDD